LTIIGVLALIHNGVWGVVSPVLAKVVGNFADVTPPAPPLVSVVQSVYEQRSESCGLHDLAIHHEKLELWRKDASAVLEPQAPATAQEKVDKCWKPLVYGELKAAKPQRIDHDSLVCSTTSIPTVSASDGFGEAHGVLKRIYGNKVVAQPQSTVEFCSFMDKFLAEELPLPDCLICHRYDRVPDAHQLCYNEWNSLDRVTRSVATKHDAALIDNANEGFLAENGKAVGGHHRRVGFVKVELNTGKTIIGDDPAEHIMDERIIQDVSARVHVALGPYMYCLSKLMSTTWGPTNWCCYASGITTEQAGQFVEPNLTYYVGDLSRFDRSITHDVLVSLNKWRAHHTHLSGEAMICLTQQENTKGLTLKGRHRYQVPGQRKSGDDNTSCDNTILNITAHAWAICKHLGVDMAWVRQHVRIMALGDDIIVSGPPELATVPFKSTLTSIGWSPKPRYEHDVTTTDFCSRIRWPSTNGPKFGCRPGRALSRFPFSSTYPSPVDVGTKAYGLYLDNSHVPFLRRYLERCMTLYPVKAVIKTKEWQFRPTDGTSLAKPNDETWAMCHTTYGLTQADEENFAAWLEQWHGGPAFADHPAVSHLLSVEAIGGTSMVLQTPNSEPLPKHDLIRGNMIRKLTPPIDLGFAPFTKTHDELPRVESYRAQQNRARVLRVIEEEQTAYTKQYVENAPRRYAEQYAKDKALADYLRSWIPW